MIGGVLATAGGVVFTGEGNGRFSAYDAQRQVLWTFYAGAGVNAPPPRTPSGASNMSWWPPA